MVGARGPARNTPYLPTDRSRRAAFLRALRESGGSFAAACRASAPHLDDAAANPPAYSTWRALMARDPEFAAQVEETLQIVRDDIEAEMHRRSMVGVEVPQYQKAQRIFEPVLDDDGEPVLDKNGRPKMRAASITRYSDALLMKRAAALMPDKYADRKTVDINHNVRGAWQVGTEDLAALSPAQKEQLTQILMTIREHRASLNGAAARIEDQRQAVEVEAVEDVDDGELAPFDLGYGESHQ